MIGGTSRLALLAFAPLVAGAVAWNAALGRLAPGTTMAELAAGLVVWTILEYGFHRFLFHIVPSSAWLRQRQQHLLHHETPDDPTYFVVPLWISIPLAAGVWALLRAALGSGPGAALVTAGVMLGYVAYELVHYRVHQGGRGGRLVRFWRRHHLYHHYADDHRCYGFTTPLWDYVFGTGPVRGPLRRSRTPAASTR
ncbi:MAG: sterol desaturase family protein [Gemmatimonadales bacterium]